MKQFSYITYLFLLGFFFSSCELEDVQDPNNPGLNGISSNATLAEIQNLVDGTLAGMRIDYGTYFDAVSVVGREVYRFSGSDPRYTGELLGAAAGVLDGGGFYTTNPYAGRYRVVKNCNILIEAVKNTKAAITAEQAKGINGFAKTIKAIELLHAFNQQYNGIRVDVANPDALGPFLDTNGSLDAIIALLNEANTDLTGAGSAFLIKLGRGFADFSTPAEFSKVNRAMLARVQAYKQNWNGVLDALNGSFIEVNGNLNKGAYRVYSKLGGDVLNDVFYPRNASGEVRVAHPSFIADAENGDKRVSKVSLRTTPATSAGLTSAYDFALYSSNTDNITIIRNEELILLLAEANLQLDRKMEGLDALDVIRNAAGLPDYQGATDKNVLIDQMLKQRRYSLYGECHRWVDLRRYNKLGDLPKDRPDDDVWTTFPRPSSEPK